MKIKNYYKVMTLKDFLKESSAFILDILFPVYCLDCGREGEWICEKCFGEIKLLKIQACPICGADSKTGAVCFNCRNKSELNGVIAAIHYKNSNEDEKNKSGRSNLVKETIHIFKYRFVKDLAKPLSALIIKQLKNRQIVKTEKSIPFGPDISDKIIIPVPLHPKRFRWRGFNQSELLAENIAAYFNLPLEKSVLSRQKNNIPQAEIKNRRDRLENIRGVFQCVNPEAVKNKKIILIDDICTTSGTLSECAKVLKEAGTREVWGAVAARG